MSHSPEPELLSPYVRAFIESSIDGILVLDAAGLPTAWNDHYLRLWGLTQEQMTQGTPDERLDHMRSMASDDELFLRGSQHILSQSNEPIQFELHLTSGSTLNGYSAPVSSDTGESLGQLVVFRDVTEHRTAESQRAFLSRHDPVTGFLNRTALYEQIEIPIREAANTCASCDCGVISLDLPCFVAIAERFGHRFGDRLLAIIADRLDPLITTNVRIARHTDAEFIVHTTDMSEAEVISLAHRAVTVVTEPIRLDDEDIQLAAHAGVTMCPTHGRDVETLVSNATIARKWGSAKQQPVALYHEQLGADEKARVSLRADLANAIDRDEFFLEYQPLFSIHTGEVTGCEALLRWNRNDGTHVSPEDFIPYAEASGLIVAIGEWVLHTACAQAKTWQDQGFSAITISVNVSARQLAEPDFTDMVKRVLHSTGLAAEHLQLEFTETMNLEETPDAEEKLKEVSQLGVTLAIDDYGSGYANLSYLRRFRFSTLKVDRPFTQRLGSSPQAGALMESAIQVAHKIGITLLAEGVETHEQLEFLREAGADLVQGFLLAPPCRASEVTRYFTEIPDAFRAQASSP